MASVNRLHYIVVRIRFKFYPSQCYNLKRPEDVGGGLMKKVYRVLLLALVTAGSAAAITPITSIGSNPYYSTGLYPQDLLLRQGNYFFYNPQYQNSPYWGDIDEPANKPNTGTDYTITGVQEMINGGSFEHSGTVHTFFNNFGYAWRLNDRIMANVEFNSDIDALRNSAKGNFTGNTYPDGKTIPFNYYMGHTLGTFSGKAMFATRLRDYPLGLMVEGGMKNSLRLTKELSFDKLMRIDNTTYDPDSTVHYSMTGDRARAFWGWAIPGCNHIFVERGTQGDSWFQNQYAMGPIYHFNLLTGITTGSIKAGGSFRMIYGHQDQYYWEPDESTIYGNDSELTERFIGEYVKDDMARMTWLGEGRFFGNITLHGNDRYSVNVFSSLRYADSSTGSALSDNLSAVNGSKDRVRSVELECYPNLSAQLGGLLNYIDIEAILAYRYSRYSNTRDAWLGGGIVKTFQTGYLTEGWSDVWENFSYANENALDLGADISTMFPIYTQGAHRLFLNLRMLGDVRFTYQSKYYGEARESGSDIDFTVNNIRRNYTREVMFNTAIMLHYMLGPMQLRFQFTKPVLYSILPRTEVTDADGNRLSGYPLEKSPQLISLRGVSLGFYGSYDVVLPFLKR